MLGLNLDYPLVLSTVIEHAAATEIEERRRVIGESDLPPPLAEAIRVTRESDRNRK